VKLELCEPQLSYPTGANHIVGFMDLQARRRWTAPGEPRSRRTSVPSPEPVPPPKEWKTKNPPRSDPPKDPTVKSEMVGWWSKLWFPCEKWWFTW